MPEALKRVGRYDVLEVIGRGGAAVVYLAHQRDLQRHVALKELAPYLSTDTSFAERFVEESRLAGSMNHANVVTVHEFFEDGGVPYIAMEYLPYGSLRQYIGQLSMAQIVGVLEGVLAGLSHGEAHGIVHRDLKPENLLVALDGRVKIADFGVARAYNKAVTRAVVTVEGTTIGTPAYMSPEQAQGQELTAATDLYSLGIVAWEMLTGQVPFDGTETPVAVLYRQVHEEIPSVRTVAPEVDPTLATWLQKVLAKRPSDRFPTADAAWEELEDIVLDLLGPRWRREARLVVAGRSARTTRSPAPLQRGGAAVLTPPPERPSEPTPSGTPAEPALTPPDEISLPSGGEGPQPLVPDTVTDLPAGPGETVAPRRGPRPRVTTQFRIARRHHDEADPEADARDVSRRRTLIGLAVALLVAAAAVGGVLAASAAKSPAHRGETAAQRRAQQRAAQQAAAVKRESAADTRLKKIVTALAPTQVRDGIALANARTPRAQESAATAEQKVYAGAAKAVKALESQTPAAAPLVAALTRTAGDYGALAAARRAGKERRFTRAGTAARAAQRQVAALVTKL